MEKVLSNMYQLIKVFIVEPLKVYLNYKGRMVYMSGSLTTFDRTLIIFVLSMLLKSFTFPSSRAASTSLLLILRLGDSL